MMELFDSVTSIVSQGSARRGSFAAYLPADHADILEFLDIRSEGHPLQEIFFGVCCSDDYMNKVKDGDAKAREVWAKIIRKGYETGMPYLHFTDNANNQAPEAYKKHNKRINASNLCNEIQLSNDEKESFVCCLSSINVEHWDDIKDTDAVETLLFFLDAVMEEYIQKVEGIPFMEKCLEFAKNQRALGLGVLGYHSLLCKKEIPFESMEAKLLNGEVFKTIREKCDKATEELAKMFGEPELLKGFGRRNITTMAVAPTTTSSLILGQVSQGIEPYQANYFVKGSAKGNFTIINPYFLKLLDKYGKNDRETLASVRRHGGSCQHLDFLTDHDKAVYKTFGEISQKEIIIQAAQRQKYIDQGQSLNMMVPPDCPAKQVSNLLIEAWELGLKGLYYRRSANPAQELSRNIDTCTSCEG